jgi:hypothetical protein
MELLTMGEEGLDRGGADRAAATKAAMSNCVFSTGSLLTDPRHWKGLRNSDSDRNWTLPQPQ